MMRTLQAQIPCTHLERPGNGGRNGKAKEKKRKEGATKRGTYRRRRSDHVNPKDLQGGEWVDGEIIGVAKGKAEEEDNDFGDVP